MGHGHTHSHGADIVLAPGIARRLRWVAVAMAVLTCIGAVLVWPRPVEQVDTSAFGVASEYVSSRIAVVREIPCPGTPEDEAAATGDFEFALCLNLDVDLLEGPDAGTRYTIELIDVGALPAFGVGQKLVLAYLPNAVDPYRYQLADRERTVPMLVLAGLFVAAVVVMARLRGAAALAGMVVSLVAIGFLMLPALVSERPPVPVALVTASLIAFLAIYLAHSPSVRVSVGVAGAFLAVPVATGILAAVGVLPEGWTTSPVTAVLVATVVGVLLVVLVRAAAPLTTVALVGTLGALVSVGVLAALFTWATTLSGLADEEARYIRAFGTFDFRGLLLAGMVIGALGALDDMTVTQASAVAELRAADPSMSKTALMAAAMRIGRDHVASTVNTLVLAYAGAALPLLLLFVESGQPLWRVVTSEPVATEIVRTLVGSIGLVVSVPLTTAIGAALVSPPTADLDTSP